MWEAKAALISDIRNYSISGKKDFHAERWGNSMAYDEGSFGNKENE